jgi:hypothetical protein
MKESPQGRADITRTAFSIIPVELIRACKHRKGTIVVYLMLWDYAGQNDAAWPSNERLADDCGMSEDDTRKAKRWLADHGWVERIVRPGKTDLFHVRSERFPHPSNGTPPPNGGVPQMGEYTPPPNDTPNKKSLTRTISEEETPPLSPRWGEAPQAAPDGQARSGQLAPIPSQQPQPAQAPAAITSPSSSALPVPSGDVPPAWPQEAQQGASAAPVLHSPAETPTAASAGQLGHDPSRSGSETVAPRKPRDPFASKVLPLDVVPDNLLDCQQLLAEWWEVKTRGRTRNAFLRACAFLSEQPQSDRRQILERAVIGGYQGLHPLPAQVTRQRGRGEYSPLETARQATAMVQRFEAAVAEDPDAAFF